MTSSRNYRRIARGIFRAVHHLLLNIIARNDTSSVWVAHLLDWLTSLFEPAYGIDAYYLGISHRLLMLLNLFNSSLVGPIQSQFGLLHALTSLNVAHNDLTGSVPSTLGTLKTSLSWIRLSNNDLTGSLQGIFCLPQTGAGSLYWQANFQKANCTYCTICCPDFTFC